MSVYGMWTHLTWLGGLTLVALSQTKASGQKCDSNCHSEVEWFWSESMLVRSVLVWNHSGGYIYHMVWFWSERRDSKGATLDAVHHTG